MAKPADVCLAYASSGPVLSAMRAILTGPLSAASAGALQRPARAAPKAIQCSFIIFSWSSAGPRKRLMLARRTEVCAAPCVFLKNIDYRVPLWGATWPGSARALPLNGDRHLETRADGAATGVAGLGANMSQREPDAPTDAEVSALRPALRSLASVRFSNGPLRACCAPCRAHPRGA